MQCARILACLSGLFVFLNSAFASPSFVAESGEARNTLIELFTSEGCSSCPPADRRLSALRSSAELWKRVVPLGFHVDYWDNLGWPDPFARPEFTARQREYARTTPSGSVYTPEFIVNGEESRYITAGKRSADAQRPGRLRAERLPGGEFLVEFIPADNAGVGAPSLSIYGALLGNGIASQVKAGENEGAQLEHDFVVLSLVKRPATRKGSSYFAEIKLTVPTAGRHARSQSVAFWVADADSLTPLQAVGGDLSSQ